MAIIWQGRGVDLQPIEIVCRSLAPIDDGFVTGIVEMGRYLLAGTPGRHLVQHVSLARGLGLRIYIKGHKAERLGGALNLSGA